MSTAQPFTVAQRIQETPKIFSLRLRPQSGKLFPYKPGQFVMLHLRDHDDSFVRERPRPYSIASLPNNGSFLITTKVHGPFTQALYALCEGSSIEVNGPFGLFTLPEDITGPIVFLAAGTGAAPVRPMIEALGALHPAVSTTLILSVPSPKEYLYQNVWESFLGRFPSFRLITTFTQETPALWQGEQGRITPAMIERAVSSITEPLFYLCGSPMFVDDMSAILAAQGIPNARMKGERFTTLRLTSPQ